LGLRGHPHAGPLLSELVEAVSVEGDSGERCHTAKRGERCHSDVIWAMKKWKDHPEWYINITERSTFEDYQCFFHRQIENDGARRCPQPCDYHPQASQDDVTGHGSIARKGNCHTTKPGEECYNHVIYTQRQAAKYKDLYSGLDAHSSFEDVQHYLSQERQCPEPCDPGSNKPNSSAMIECHTARPGESCFSAILFAKNKFIVQHASWYRGSGLTKNSSNDDFQAYLHNQDHVDDEAGKKQCPKPCDRTAESRAEVNLVCETARSGECYDSVMYGATRGIKEHPEWYSNLTSQSSFEDFQLHIYTGPKPKCNKAPCPCQNAVVGDACHRSIEWVKSVGVKKHPEDFFGITALSSDLDVQRLLHEKRMEPCPRPCVPIPW